jgi:hypothetical protein
MAVITPTRFTASTDLNAYESKGIRAYAQVYASTSAIVLVPAFKQHVCYAALTGAMTINATLTQLVQYDEVEFHFTADTTSRVVTFGTGFINLVSNGLVGATLTIPVSSNADVSCVYDGTSLRITKVQVENRGTTTEAPAYATPLEVTDQFASLHRFLPAQLTGALTIDATAVTKWIAGDEILIHLSTDGTQRVVTFGANFLASGTLTIPASKTATVRGYFNGTKICIYAREISA